MAPTNVHSFAPLVFCFRQSVIFFEYWITAKLHHLNIKSYGWGQEKCCLKSYGIASQGLQLSNHAAKRLFQITLILNQWVYGKDLDERIFCHFVLGSFFVCLQFFMLFYLGGDGGLQLEFNYKLISKPSSNNACFTIS